MHVSVCVCVCVCITLLHSSVSERTASYPSLALKHCSLQSLIRHLLTTLPVCLSSAPALSCPPSPFSLILQYFSPFPLSSYLVYISSPLSFLSPPALSISSFTQSPSPLLSPSPLSLYYTLSLSLSPSLIPLSFCHVFLPFSLSFLSLHLLSANIVNNSYTVAVFTAQYYLEHSLLIYKSPLPSTHTAERSV